jgi:hypothetical protein
LPQCLRSPFCTLSSCVIGESRRVHLNWLPACHVSSSVRPCRPSSPDRRGEAQAEAIRPFRTSTASFPVGREATVRASVAARDKARRLSYGGAHRQRPCATADAHRARLDRQISKRHRGACRCGGKDRLYRLPANASAGIRTAPGRLTSLRRTSWRRASSDRRLDAKLGGERWHQETSGALAVSLCAELSPSGSPTGRFRMAATNASTRRQANELYAAEYGRRLAAEIVATLPEARTSASAARVIALVPPTRARRPGGFGR